jgi:hypothetical protein
MAESDSDEDSKPTKNKRKEDAEVPPTKKRNFPQCSFSNNPN